MATNPSPAPSGTTQPVRAQRVVRGRVVFHLKDAGLYLVGLWDGANIACSGLCKAVDMSSEAPYGTGAVVDVSPITVGSNVWVQTDDVNTFDSDIRTTGLGVILGIDNGLGKPNTLWHPPWCLTAAPVGVVDFLTGVSDPVIQSIIKAGGFGRIGDRSAGRPMDLCDGDWIAQNALKGYLGVFSNRVSIAGGPFLGMHFFTAEDTCVFNTGSTFVQDGVFGRTVTAPDKDGTVSTVTHQAITAGQGLGAYGTSEEALNWGVEPPDHGYRLAEDVDPLPIWRHQAIKGALVQGEQDSLILPAPDKTGGLRKAEDGFHSVVQDYRGYDGTRVMTSMNSATLARDPYIPALSPLKDALDTPEAIPEDKAPPSDIMGSLTADQMKYASQYADLMYELMKRQFVERYWGKATSLAENWKADLAEDICEKVFNQKPDDTDPPLRGLGADAPCYETTEDDLVTIKDDQGVEHKVFRSPGYLHQSPTGGVILSDGYGAEIRMEGGNLTITAPGDIRILPGRDLVSLIPRTTSIFGQGRVDIASDKDEVAIKAHRNLALASINGTAVLESRATTPTKATDMTGRNEAGGGVVVRSATTTTVVGRNVRVGLQSGDDESTTGRKDSSGALLLDSGGGTSLLTGSAVMLAGDLISASTAGGAGMVLAGGNATIGGAHLSLPASKVSLGGTSVKVGHPVMKADGLQTTPVTLGAGAATLVSVKGSIVASDTVAAGQVVSSYVRATTVGANNGSKYSGIRTTDTVDPVWKTMGTGIESQDSSTMLSAVTAATAPIAQAVSEDKLFTAAGTKAPGLYYPKSDEYHCTSEFFMVPTRWQRKLQRGGGGKKWTPLPVRAPLGDEEGLPYPGLDCFANRACIKKATFNDNKLIIQDVTFPEGYPVNAEITQGD